MKIFWTLCLLILNTKIWGSDFNHSFKEEENWENPYVVYIDFFASCRQGNIENFNRLLPHALNLEIDFDTSDEEGNTHLIAAASMGHKEILHGLIQNGANINWINHEGYTPLMFAAISGHTTIVTDLLNLGAEKTLQNKDGHTALNLTQIMIETLKPPIEETSTKDLPSSPIEETSKKDLFASPLESYEEIARILQRKNE